MLNSSDIIQLGAVEVLYDYDDGTITTNTRTRTGIDLDSTDITVKTVITKMDNLSPFARDEKKRGAKSQKVILGMLGLLVLGIIALLGFVVYLIINKPTT